MTIMSKSGPITEDAIAEQAHLSDLDNEVLVVEIEDGVTVDAIDVPAGLSIVPDTEDDTTDE